MGFFKDLFTIYSTTRVVQIPSKSLAITYVILVGLVWFAILKSYQLDLRKIYQKPCPVRGTFTTKVKGVLSTEHLTDEELNITSPEQYQRIWDGQDLIMPGEEGFTVVTNLIITADQRRAICTSNSATCLTDNECARDIADKSFDGILSGYCNVEGKCLVSAWCPTEDDVLPLKGLRPLFDIRNFSVFVKNSVEFPDCEAELPLIAGEQIYRKRNLLKNLTSDYLRTCRYDPISHPFCPIFVLGDIVKWTGQKYNEVAITGGIFTIAIIWQCEFDWGLTIDDCLPTYTFVRTDVLDSLNVAPGFNWRSAHFFEGNRRTLTKYYGLRFHIKIAGEGRKFDFLLLVVTIGATIGLFSFAPLFCDSLFDIFCYMKTLRFCSRCFPDSFNKDIRYQSVRPLTPPLPPPPQRADSNNLWEMRDTEYSTSLSCDTKL